MKQLSSAEIRQKWLDYFVEQNHLVIPSANLIPHHDPSLLWINSGVAALKPYFSAQKLPPAPRMVNVQRAIRANDIAQIGKTSRHQTFFEMLGNFSIGDYFKKEAIFFGYDFLVRVLELPVTKLYITYYAQDLATKKAWLKLGIKESHLIAGTRAMNFWDVGAGPCGPDTEIFYDRGVQYDARGVELIAKDFENERYIEIWNIVFSQFNNDGAGNYTDLAQKNIDTGAGLERIVAIMQKGHTNFDTDLFLPIISAISALTVQNYEPDNYFKRVLKQTSINTKFKIIADHLRTVVYALNDGATISNLARGYVLRKLVRRAYRAGMQLEIKPGPFLYKLVAIVAQISDLKMDVAKISKLIKAEEIIFSKTLLNGEKMLAKSMTEHTFNLATAFKLHETYGFPIELTQEIIAEQGFKIDRKKFATYVEKHANLSRQKRHVAMQKQLHSLQSITAKVSQFTGYEELNTATKVWKMFDETTEVTELPPEGGYVIFVKTPFYATSGGQHHDQGIIIQNNQITEVVDVFKDKYQNHVHQVKGALTAGAVNLFVQANTRLALARNHTATHLLFTALRTIYGASIVQLGSDITAERLTFDFPLPKRPTSAEIIALEKLVISYINLRIKREYFVTTMQKAKAMQVIMTLEEEAYFDQNQVRVVKFGAVTTDLCGGTHLENTQLLENFKIINVDNKGAGTYRIRAVTSFQLVNQYLKAKIAADLIVLQNIVAKTKRLAPNYRLEAKPSPSLIIFESNINCAIAQAKSDYKRFFKTKLAPATVAIKHYQVGLHDLYVNFAIPNRQTIKPLAANLREQYPHGVIVLTSLAPNATIVVASKAVDAHQLLQEIFQKIAGKGGGNKLIAQGVISDPTQLLTFLKTFFKVQNA